MNAGFLAMICAWFLILFLWMGWLDAFFAKCGLRKSLVIILLLLYLFGMWWDVPFISGGQIAVFGFGLPFILALYLWGRAVKEHRLHLFASSLLIGSTLILIKLFMQIDPVLMMMDEKYIFLGFTTVLVFIVSKDAVSQLILLSLGLIFADICYQYYLWEHSGSYLLGNAGFCDLWWTSLYLVSFVRIVSRRVKRPAFFRRKRAEIS